MATLYSSHLLSASNHFKEASTKMALKTHQPFFHGFRSPILSISISLHPFSEREAPLEKEGFSQCTKECHCSLSFKPYGVFQNSRHNILCAINMSAGQSDNPGKTKFERLLDMTMKLWESTPPPVKSFPWSRAFDNFILLILDLILAVIKYLSVPLLLVSSLSEMSYCAYQKKLFLVPVPLLIGVAVAGVLRQTAIELSPLLKGAEVPWHLIYMAIFFTLLKLAGPSYPFWGRILIPHFANGGLLSTLWAFLWCRSEMAPRNQGIQ